MSMTHCICEGVALRSDRIEGMATLTMVASMDTISRLRQQDVRMTAFRRRLSLSTTLVITQLLCNHNYRGVNRRSREQHKGPRHAGRRGPLSAHEQRPSTAR